MKHGFRVAPTTTLAHVSTLSSQQYFKIDALQRVFGPPDQIKDCGDKKLWLYNHPLSLAD